MGICNWFKKKEVDPFDKTVFIQETHSIRGVDYREIRTYTSWKPIKYSGRTVILDKSTKFEVLYGGQIQWVSQDILKFPTGGCNV